LIKSRVRNRLGSKNLEALLRIALEGPKEFDDILQDAIPLWKNETKYKFFYANPSIYLSTPATSLSASNASSSFGDVH
jgi:hypothetical protein